MAESFPDSQDLLINVKKTKQNMQINLKATPTHPTVTLFKVRYKKQIVIAAKGK